MTFKICHMFVTGVSAEYLNSCWTSFGYQRDKNYLTVLFLLKSCIPHQLLLACVCVLIITKVFIFFYMFAFSFICLSLSGFRPRAYPYQPVTPFYARALATFCALSCFNDAPSTTTTTTTMRRRRRGRGRTTATPAGRTRTRAIKCYESCHLWDHYKHTPHSPLHLTLFELSFPSFAACPPRLEALKTFSALSHKSLTF